ncbi:MAG TPA: GAF domain-containing protein [Gaiellaceae bacterium]|nr:GAF domain-containing protein [Gaiellaceae bacterium]
MSHADEAVYFNAVPLFVLAGAYLLVAAALAPTLWRERRRVTVSDVALAAVFPAVAVPAAIFGAVVLHDRSPIGGHVWPPFAATFVALLPAIVFLRRWSEPAGVVMSGPRAREAEQLVSVRDRELDTVARLVNALARTHDPVEAARLLLDEVEALVSTQFNALALVSADEDEASGLLARSDGADLTWWSQMRVHLHNEPSGIASAFFEAAPVSVFDCESSPLVNPRLAQRAGAKSAAFVPLIVDERVIGVLVAATTSQRRMFAAEELRLIEALAGEAAIALDRTRSASALDHALARERLVAKISRRVRSGHDLDAVTRIAVNETGRALGASRCFLRIGEPGDAMPVRAEWFGDGLEPLASTASALPVSNLAARERRTVAVADVADAPELRDASLGDVEALARLGTRSALDTPVIVYDRMIGVLGLHRSEPGPWAKSDVLLAEAVARELGLAVHTARLLDENERRLGEQSALLKAAQTVTSELELDAVLQRLVDEVAALLGAEAVDCFLLDRDRGVLRCAAVHGSLEGIVGFEFPADRGLSARAIARGRPVLSDDYGAVAGDVPHPGYEGFRSALVAPMRWSGEVMGILGVGTRDEERRFTGADASLLEAFANLAALALRNAESFAERSRQARIQRGFYRIASVLGEPISQEETFDALAQAAAEALGSGSAAVLMPRDDDLRLEGMHGLPGLLVQFLEDGLGDPSGPLRASARNGRVLAAPRLADDERFDGEWQRVAAESGLQALLAVPVEAPRTDECALVIVFFADERRFTDDDLELARNLAGAARGALERSELFEAERRARALAQQLARTGTLLATELDPASLLDEVVRQAPSLLEADAAVIRLLEGDELLAGAAVGEHGAEVLDSRVASTARLAGDAVQSRSPVAVVDARDDQRLLQADPMLAAGFASCVAAPLVGPEGAVHGVLSVYCRAPRAWREEEIEALAAFAGNASAALSSAELYQSVALEKERSVAILANIADGIVAVDRDGKVVLWNAAAERITGVPGEEALHRPPAEVLQRELESDEDAPAGERLVSIRRGGEEIWLSLTEAVMRDPAGAVAGRIFAFRDISAERVVEEMKSEFVSNVSRELRSPLTSIYGFAETLLRGDVVFGEEERKTFLGYIASEAGRLTAIVDRLLAVAQLDSGDLQVQVAATDVGELVSEVVAAAKQSLVLDGHEFVLDLPPEPLAADADREKLRQIVTDLVENAVKYSPGGGTVTVAARRRDDSVEVSVQDEGIGIPQAEQNRIFAKFYRAETGRRALAGGGTGLGLFIAKELLAAMHGRIWVRSLEGEGSTFTFALPLAARRVLSERE